MILVLTRMSTRLCKTIIQNDPSAPSDMRRDAGEDAPPLQILIEATIDEFPQEATALRTPPTIRHVEAEIPLFQGICRALGIGVGMQQEGDEIADAGEAQPQNQRILGSINELIDPARSKSLRQIAMIRRGDGLAMIVEACELPGL